eukprot:CAMPEP_0197024166 /NCGR_PEP_ID=MMETSP1384-20130603/4796_1 /TAXON_ID=29189 /ORGANISM="Ammonia sp." /LENGTH=106 /DNA_ID=CAMNT_0042452511 /DNA_START=24 /DNA_END=344 /DNA_ORIENTATION=-
MAQYNKNAQPQPQDKNEYVAHQFHVNAHFDAKSNVITLTVNDAVSKKKWELQITQQQEQDIKGTYDKIKVAVDTSKMACSFPDEGKPLDLVLMTQPEYLSYELPEC